MKDKLCTLGILCVIALFSAQLWVDGHPPPSPAVQVLFIDKDGDPNITGQLIYDNTITGLDDGGLVWYDDDEIRIVVDLDASEGTLAAGDDTHVVTFNWNGGNGYFDLQEDDTGAGGGDPVLVDTVAISDGSGVDLTSGVGVDITLNAGASPDTATFALDATEIDAVTWSDNANASNAWTFDVSGTDHTMTAGNGLMTFSHAVTTGDDITIGADEKGVVWGAGSDIKSKWNETDDLFSLFTTKTATQATDYAVFTVAADSGNSSMTANQEVFEVGRGGPDDSDGNFVELFAVDEDGDATVAGTLGVTGLISGSAGVNLGTSQSLLGTTAITIGDNNQTIAINSSDWDIDATGAMTGIGAITSDGVITATGFTIGAAAITEAELEILDGATLGTADVNIIDGISDSGTLTAAELLYVDGVTSAIQTQFSNILDGTTAFTDFNGADIIDSDNYNADSVDNEHINWADIDNLADEGALVSGTDPDTNAVGEITHDTDGANETNDTTYRGWDGTNQFPVGQKMRTINVILTSPDTIDAADLIPIFHNTTGMTFTIVEWKAWSDDDNVSLDIEELTDMTDFTAITTVDVVEIATDGTSVYYASDTTIAHAAIEHDHTIAIDFDTTDTPDYVHLTITGWFNADVD